MFKLVDGLELIPTSCNESVRGPFSQLSLKYIEV